MKLALSTLFGFVLTFNVYAETLRLSEPVTQDAQSETFGVKLDNSLPKLSMKNLLTDSSSHLAKPFQVEARIAKVCQKKGCFFIAQQDQHILRVSFRDYSFFIPTDSSGKTVMLAGELVQKEVSPEQAAHFKADLRSETDMVKLGVVYEIVADSVKIPRSE
ncbi:DUF4920 domain-containing protein [Paraglaciecola psychrophila]|jgi:hypothetical protein|uniref:DUF4920 domain-containing protein n=1 Tax=Paraglaciecola psychrophila 170 TaxID=1129794 RepID=K6ZMV7_9ALTE|nr:DUF4920 domain-containing protein [Paraglaciecola psychrophila]AGH43873.1 hypothetical protein C427_1764 [Paraglaciecola psychrophila 170]GAC37281.1 hypothetical protein GPSY_1652 [Paraglaciecola psychrophila 170]